MNLSRLRFTLSSAAIIALTAVWVFQDSVPIPGVFGLACAAEPATSEEEGDTKFAKPRPWDAERDFPRPIREDKSVEYDYPIVYVRVARPYPKEYFNINHLNQAGLHQTNAPGAELRILHPDGRDESLVPVEPQESITDPAVSLDGQWVYFAKFHQMATGATANMTKLQSKAGADIYKVHVASRKVVQLTSQERTPSGAIRKGAESHVRGVHNLAPCPVAGGKVVFVSDRNGVRGVREQTQPALQLFVMDEDGGNVEHIGPLNLGTALHPVALKDGRVMFSSLETQGLRSDERWGIWAIHPDGTNWGPLTSALGSPPGQAVHFQAQLSDESIVVESYYQTGSTDGFGTYWKFPLHASAEPPFGNGAKEFAPRGIRQLTLFANFADVRPNHKENQVYNQAFAGNVTQPACAPDNHLLTTWALPWDAQDKSVEVYDAGIYLLKSGRPINHPSKMLLVKNDPHYQELWPRALVPFKRIYGIDEPPRLTHRNDGHASPHLPAGTPFGLVGTSSLYKRESYPSGVVPSGSVTAASPTPNDRKKQWRELAVSRFGKPGNWGEQGADAGLYENSDIWGIRILLLEPVSDAVHKERRHYALGSNSEERIRILGEFPVRKFQSSPHAPREEPRHAERDDYNKQPVDPDGNPDTSFLAKVPADVAWTFQTLDNNGMVLNMAQTWHQVRPGEIRNNCGGCHAHSQQPTLFEHTAAARPDYKIWDLTKETPLFAARAEKGGQKWDKEGKTSVEYAKRAVKDVEFTRDIKPLLERSCVACHTRDEAEPPGKLALDDYRPAQKDGLVPWAENVHIPKELPRTYARLVQYAWSYQSRRSPLVWKIFGRRLDGFDNGDIASPPLDYENEKNVLEWCHQGKNRERDVDFAGSSMPPLEAIAGTYKTAAGKSVKVPLLSADEKLTFVRWIDIGCPIDTEYTPGESGRGWLLDEGRPTLTVASPEPGTNTAPLRSLVVGMYDYLSGLDPASFSVVADFELDGIPAGENLAPKFKLLPDNRWEFVFSKPIEEHKRGNLTISIKDRQGNATTIKRTFSIERAAK